MLSLSNKLSNKFDTDQLFDYILNIQKMCHQHQPSSSFIVWTFFKCFDRDLRELKQNNKFDTNQLFHYILNIQKCVIKTSQVVSSKYGLSLDVLTEILES